MNFDFNPVGFLLALFALVTGDALYRYARGVLAKTVPLHGLYVVADNALFDAGYQARRRLMMHACILFALSVMTSVFAVGALRLLGVLA